MAAEREMTAIVLAAGKSTRMRSRIPKALHLLCGRPLIVHILDALAHAGVTRRIVVVGHQAEIVRQALDVHFGAGTIEYAEQHEQKGTGHAVQMAEPLLADQPGTVLVVPGDTPLLTGEILQDLIAAHREQNASATLLTAVLPDAGAYGRVVRNGEGDVVGIVEARDATESQRAIREINTAVYAFESDALRHALQNLRPDNAQNEYYLTDVIGILRGAGKKVGAVVSPDADVVLGVNTRVELAQVSHILRHRLLNRLMLSGVSVVDPATTFVDVGVTVGQETVLLPFTSLTGNTWIGEDCIIGPNANLHDTEVGNRVQIRATFSDQAIVGNDCRIGPFAHLRPGTRLADRVKLGNFVETKNSTIGTGTAAGHLSYLGDATIGEYTNIGGGTITCNYDGYEKHPTTIGSNVFIGSNASLVAPVTVGAGAATAAGSVIVDDVPPDALAIARQRQTNKEGWAARRREARATDPIRQPNDTNGTTLESRPSQ